MANPLLLQKIVAQKIAREGQTATLTWAGGGRGAATIPAETLPIKALKVTETSYLTGAKTTTIYLPATERSIIGATLTIGDIKHVIQSAGVTAPNDIKVIQEVIIT